MTKETAAGRGERRLPWIEVLQVYTDGSALGNPGPGGYALVWKLGGKTRTLVGGEPHTTNGIDGGQGRP